MVPIDIMKMRGSTASGTASLSDFSVLSQQDEHNATARCTVNADGFLYAFTTEGGTVLNQQWKDSGLASSFEINVVPTLGTFSSGVTGTWTNLATSQVWSVTKNAVTPGSKSVTAIMYIRLVGSTTPLTQCTFTLTAEVSL